MLTAIIGEMGKGKTATLTFLAEHFKRKGYNIYANYHLKNINYKHVISTADIESVHNGKAFYDEFWLWLDSRCSSFDESNKQISDILLKSRKRDYDITYTLQGFYQIDKRIRNVTDYILLPKIYFFDELTNELQTIDQTYLYPIDTKPFIEKMVCCVDICKPAGEYDLEKVEEFSFWLKNIIGSYDTTEEICGIKEVLQKGIYVEAEFIKHMKNIYNEIRIEQAPNSGHYLNTLDVEIVYNEKLILIDVMSITQRKTKSYEYFYLDRREKKLKKAQDIGKSRKGEIWTAYKFLGTYTFVDMNNEKFIRLCSEKELINIKDLKEIELSDVDFVKYIKGEK